MKSWKTYRLRTSYNSQPYQHYRGALVWCTDDFHPTPHFNFIDTSSSWTSSNWLQTHIPAQIKLRLWKPIAIMGVCTA